MPQNPTIIPGLRYADAPAAIEFLCRAFGFERRAVYADEKDPSNIPHAQLVLNGSMIMLGSARKNPATDARPRRIPPRPGEAPIGIYVVVADADAHHARAKAQGAEIVAEPHPNEGYPGRGYGARDPEGNDWNFGAYNPWTE
jgi:uncharacterized glyoxalase superfamily protein PhnB